MRKQLHLCSLNSMSLETFQHSCSCMKVVFAYHKLLLLQPLSLACVIPPSVVVPNFFTPGTSLALTPFSSLYFSSSSLHTFLPEDFNSSLQKGKRKHWKKDGQQHMHMMLHAVCILHTDPILQLLDARSSLKQAWISHYGGFFCIQKYTFLNEPPSPAWFLATGNTEPWLKKLRTTNKLYQMKIDWYGFISFFQFRSDCLVFHYNWID